MVRIALSAVLVLATVACSNPFPVGPGHVAISLDQVKIVSVDYATLRPESSTSSTTPDPREALELVISSQTELLGYFAEWDRQVQVRCAVEGNVSGRRYDGVALRPVAKEKIPSKPYQYTVYAFFDLKAHDSEYENGRPATTLNLRTERFDALRCHLLGVTKAPVLFPRSNDVLVSGDYFRELLRQSGA